MRSVEDQVRDVLRDRADEARGFVQVPPRLRSRVRRRLLSQVTVLALMVATIGVGAAFGLERLFEDDRRPGQNPQPAPTDLPPRDRVWIVGGVISRGTEFQLVMTYGVDGWCSGVRYEGSGGLGCPRTGRAPLQLGESSGTDRPRIVHGAVSFDVARVVLTYGRRDVTSVELHGPPPGSGAPFRVFGAVVPRGATVLVRVFDENGRALDRAQLEPDPEVIEDPIGGGLSRNHQGAIVDIHENVWAHLHPSEFDSDPSAAPGATRVPVGTIRFTAGLRVEKVWWPVREWWASRPSRGDDGDAFILWWRSYPFGSGEE